MAKGQGWFAPPKGTHTGKLKLNAKGRKVFGNIHKNVSSPEISIDTTGIKDNAVKIAIVESANKVLSEFPKLRQYFGEIYDPIKRGVTASERFDKELIYAHRKDTGDIYLHTKKLNTSPKFQKTKEYIAHAIYHEFGHIMYHNVNSLSSFTNGVYTPSDELTKLRQRESLDEVLGSRPKHITSVWNGSERFATAFADVLQGKASKDDIYIKAVKNIMSKFK